MGSLVAAGVNASELTRRAYLGLSGEPAEDNEGLRVTYVGVEATAEMAGLAIGDSLVSINDQPIATFADLIDVASALRERDAVVFEVQRGQQILYLEADAIERPREEVAGMRVDYEEVQVETGISRIITYRPDNGDRLPALFYLQGFNCASIDFGGASDDPIRRFVEDVARQGFVVIRQEKPGVGDSISSTACEDLTFDEEMSAFASGLQSILQRSDVDQEAVFLFGHSLGGVTAPGLALEVPLLGIATYGAPSRPWFEYLVDVLEEQPSVLGRNPALSEYRARIGIPFLSDVMTGAMSWEQVKEAHPEALRARILASNDDQILFRNPVFLRTLNGFDVEHAWRSFGGEVLAIHGTFDVNVISDKDAHNLLRLVNEDGAGVATLVILEGAEHGLSRPESSMSDYIQDLRFGRWTQSMALQAYDPRIAAETVSWMRKVLAEDDD